jgi:2-C-methyl-D-erythritol 2,4-cyclodiphosphate synthase
MSLRIGHGYDVHAFGPGTNITLASCRIPHDQGVIAHSDGDVVIHALCDAILGALAMGDIGDHFPDTDLKYKGINSGELLKEVYSLANEKGWILCNADITLIAQAPKVSPYKQQMRSNLAELLHCQPDQVNIKATTTEHMGFIGRKEGLASYAVVLLTKA